MFISVFENTSRSTKRDIWYPLIFRNLWRYIIVISGTPWWYKSMNDINDINLVISMTPAFGKYLLFSENYLQVHLIVTPYSEEKWIIIQNLPGKNSSHLYNAITIPNIRIGNQDSSIIVICTVSRHGRERKWLQYCYILFGLKDTASLFTSVEEENESGRHAYKLFSVYSLPGKHYSRKSFIATSLHGLLHFV